MSARLVRYRSHDDDSQRWVDFDHRRGDIVISTRSKHGTTWMQMICAVLVSGEPDLPVPLAELSPWLDWLVVPRDEVVARLDGQHHRRVLKTHTPLDGLPLEESVSYVVVARHPLDAALSLYHHGANIDRARQQQLTGRSEPSPTTAELPAAKHWLRAWIDADPEPARALDSLPGVLHHLTDAWNRRGDHDVVTVRYADLVSDLDTQMRTLAHHLDIDVDAERWPELVDAARFDAMQARADDLAPDPVGILVDRRRFFRSGRPGEAAQLLESSDLDRYLERAAALAPPDLLAWLHQPVTPCPTSA